MSPSPHRARITVSLGAGWKIYSNTIPAGSRALGTVSRDGYDTGALALIETTGIYVRVNAGAIRSLDQRKVSAAVEAARAGSHGGAGRGQGIRAKDGATALVRKQVSLDDATITTLTALGDGELSLGIRRAAAHIKSP